MISKSPAKSARRHSLVTRILAQELEESEARYFHIVAENEYLRMANEELRAHAHADCACKPAGAPSRLTLVQSEGIG